MAPGSCAQVRKQRRFCRAGTEAVNKQVKQSARLLKAVGAGRNAPRAAHLQQDVADVEASFFDYVRVDDGRIVERIQQADVLGQMRQFYGKALGLIGLDAMFPRL